MTTAVHFKNHLDKIDLCEPTTAEAILGNVKLSQPLHHCVVDRTSERCIPPPAALTMPPDAGFSYWLQSISNLFYSTAKLLWLCLSLAAVVNRLLRKPPLPFAGPGTFAIR
jgi:hypothetical protein